MPQPLFSICIPNYNYGRFLTTCLDSVLSQTFEDFEVIVCDNCSTDNSRDILNSYRDSRLKVIYQTETVPVASNFNRCMFAAEGRYLKALPSDDSLFPWYLETIREAISLYPEAQLLITPSLRFGDDNEIYTVINTKMKGKWVLCDINDALRLDSELKINMVMPTNNAFKAESFRKTGGYHEESVYGSQWSFDFVLLCKLLTMGPIALYTAPLCAERIHSGQGRCRKDSSQVLYDYFLGINHLLSSGKLNPIETIYLKQLLSRTVGHFFCYGFKHLILGDFKIALHTAQVFIATGLVERPLYVVRNGMKISYEFLMKK